MSMFRDAVEILHKMWTEETPTFHGKHDTIDQPVNKLRGVQTPHIPLWIGGSGEQVTLRLVACFGGACNIGGQPDNIQHKLEVLRRHCDSFGRDHDDSIKSRVHVIGDGVR